ncbi:AglZ/HisF2 family acetamidino modification protein [Citrobacter werkmanii]|uniref:AglZ/HisF2 family acetamidino modification protein n=1 Tax=Citrobacter werkmanii TaxID=67827 RepID=UPI0034D65719
MLLPRIIPVLLVRDKGLVKTVKFKDAKYVGDPLNAVKIFNEKQVDELIIIDIDATAKNLEPDYKLIESVAAECRMPLCYAGGIKTEEQAQRILGLGVEKVALSSALFDSPEMVKSLSGKVGAQSVVGVLDVKKSMFGKKYVCVTHNACNNRKIDLHDFIGQVSNLGLGELLINSIDNDGMMKGYDLNLISSVKKEVSIPLTVLGGAGSMADIHSLVKMFPIIGAAAGSLFVFKGKYKAVLINYPNSNEKFEY